MRREIRIAGFGGQGVVTIGLLVAKVLGESKELFVAQTQSYGPEARGGACKTDIVFSDSEIDYIKPLDVDIFVSLSQPAFDNYSMALKKDCIVLVDKELVKAVPPEFSTVKRIPATDLALNMFGTSLSANIIAFGALAQLIDVIDAQDCKTVLAGTFNAKFQSVNEKAFDLGYTYNFS